MAAPTTLEDLPSATVPPKGAVIPKKVRRARARMARREFLRTTGMAAVGTGMAFAGLFPTARRAHATHPQTMSDACYGPNSGQSYAGSTGCCACGSTVSSTMCGGGTWHRHDYAGCGGYSYRIRYTSCGGDGNAWYWWREGVRWRCSDGQRQYCTTAQCTCGSWGNTVCPVNTGP